VVGATGLQGGATVRALLGANAPVRALARRTDSAAARALTELGTDLDDPESLRAAFTGVDGVFAMTTPRAGFPRRRAGDGVQADRVGTSSLAGRQRTATMTRTAAASRSGPP
jgi:uncharacterized protein YbjT (DUF2867 family)